MRRVLALLVVPVAWFGAGFLTPAAAQGGAPPVLVLSSGEAKIGDKVVVRFEGWNDAGVTLTICGNEGLRGAPDCDVARGQGIGLLRGKPTLAELKVEAPPATCPCVVRAATSTGSAVQTAPLVILGAPVGPLVRPGPPKPLVAVSAEVSDVGGGLGRTLRTLLGGRREQQVSITLRNTSTATLSKVSLGVAVGRTVDGARPVAVPAVEPLAPGESRVYDVPAAVSAPAWGRYVWDVTADGAGPRARTEVRSSATPWLLYLLAGLLVVDIAALTVRRLGRRKQRRRNAVGGRAMAVP